MNHHLTQLPIAVCLATASLLSGCAKLARVAATHTSSERFVLTPDAIVTVSADHETQGLPGEVCFGGPFGRSALFLNFPSTWRARGAPTQAFLALAQAAGAASDDFSTTVEAWRVSQPWQAAAVHAWSDKPELAPPYARAQIGNWPSQDVRINVTELLRFAAQHPERDFGIALIASGGAGHGTTFSTGMSGGRAPRLELYFGL